MSQLRLSDAELEAMTAEEVVQWAYDEYGHSDARASKVAWSAVSHSYKKRDGKWVKK